MTTPPRSRSRRGRRRTHIFRAYPDRQPLFAAMIASAYSPNSMTTPPRSRSRRGRRRTHIFRVYPDRQPLFAAMIGKRIFFERGNFPLAVKTNRKFGSVSISSSRSAEHRCDTTFAPRHLLCAVTSALFADAFAPLSSTMVRAIPLQNISFPYCRAKALSRRPAMLHCNNCAVLFATALLYRLCQTAPIKPRDRLCSKDLSKEVILLVVRAIFSLFGFDSAAAAARSNRASPAQLPHIRAGGHARGGADQAALHLRNCPLFRYDALSLFLSVGDAFARFRANLHALLRFFKSQKGSPYAGRSLVCFIASIIARCWPS